MIKYDIKVDYKLEEILIYPVNSLIEKSFKDANQKSRAYSEDAQNYYLVVYSPENMAFWPTWQACVLASFGDKLVGSGFLGEHVDEDSHRIVEGERSLHGMYINPTYQRRGIGTTILNHIVAHAKEKNIKTIHAHTPDFPLTQKFYEKFGFIKGGERFFGEVHKLKFHKIRYDIS